VQGGLDGVRGYVVRCDVGGGFGDVHGFGDVYGFGDVHGFEGFCEVGGVGDKTVGC
jgi:hypothetical protein